MIRKLLIANRGEIAVRIMRASRELGIPTVAVCSEPDQDSLHPKMADEVVVLEGKLPDETYLNTSKIIDATKKSGANAIHPGYGFLSEQGKFAEVCSKAGLIFVGPTPLTMYQLGSKTEAKQLARSLGIPLVPGFFSHDASKEELLEAAHKIGFPVVLKAVAGGGGRGVRVVKQESEFFDSLARASDEALKAFGESTMMLEKWIPHPRHVEVQIAGDQHGHVISLFERECSIQRRYQKLIEESPSPLFSSSHGKMWPQIKEAAIKLAQAAGYQSLGTVEFLVDEVADEFYFLEVNPRLQVEHPVTEAVTGIDLVQMQLKIAMGEHLGTMHTPDDSDRHLLRGHSIEARIIAEDPANGFTPSIGQIIGWAEPRGLGVRVDAGYQKGGEVSPYYDSLLAKVIVHAQTREMAIHKLEAALKDFHILGVKTNISYLLDVINHPDFLAGKYDTGFLEREFGDWNDTGALPEYLFNLYEEAQKAIAPDSVYSGETVWGLGDNWSNIGTPDGIRTRDLRRERAMS